jgi:hypothetical protein
MFALYGIIQRQSDGPYFLDRLPSGPIPIIVLVVLGLVIAGVWISLHLKRLERRLRNLGKDYYNKDQEILDKLKAGLISDAEYRKGHQRLLREMRDISNRMADGPPK